MEYFYLWALNIYISMKSLLVLQGISLIWRLKNSSPGKGYRQREHNFGLKEALDTK